MLHACQSSDPRYIQTTMARTFESNNFLFILESQIRDKQMTFGTVMREAKEWKNAWQQCPHYSSQLAVTQFESLRE